MHIICNFSSNFATKNSILIFFKIVNFVIYSIEVSRNIIRIEKDILELR